jgi:hypothetical protein
MKLYIKRTDVMYVGMTTGLVSLAVLSYPLWQLLSVGKWDLTNERPILAALLVITLTAYGIVVVLRIRDDFRRR